MSDNLQRVFVYGTLKRGLENDHYMKGQTFIGQATSKPLYRMYDFGGYPGIVHADNGYAIQGEVWEVDEACKKQLDILEDIAIGLYTCEPIELDTPFEAQHVKAYYYAFPILNQMDVGGLWDGPLASAE